MAWIEATEYHVVKHNEAAVRRTLAELGLDPDRYVTVTPRRNEGWRGYELTQDVSSPLRDIKTATDAMGPTSPVPQQPS